MKFYISAERPANGDDSMSEGYLARYNCIDFSGRLIDRLTVFVTTSDVLVVVVGMVSEFSVSSKFK